jgi:butyryl-CoA dehydrogenase
MRDTLDFLLHDWLQAEELIRRPRFAEHTRETFEAVLDTCERIARERFAPFNRLVDTEEPRVEGDRVVLPQATHEAWRAYAESGMLAAAQDYALGGMQLPYLVESAANTFFAKASVSIGAGMLTVGNANLLMAYGTPAQQRVFAQAEFAGRWSGTMCLSEPQAGSSLSDVATRAEPDAGGNARATACAAARCGSPRASTSSPRTSSTSCWPRFPVPTDGSCRAPAASRSSSCPSTWSTARASSPASATTSRWRA